MPCSVRIGVRRAPWAIALAWALLAGLPTVSRALAAPRISEFLASNDRGLKDEDGDFSDWIEIHNPQATPVSLEGYHLTDREDRPREWTFPAVVVPAGGRLVVFASGKDRRDPAANLHTDFQLAAEGEFLALVAPDGVTWVSLFAPRYPPLKADESFGLDEASSVPVWRYYSGPTPGAANGVGTAVGPLLEMIEPHPPQPVGGPLEVAVRVRPTNEPVGAVRLHYRRMFAVETTLAMRDDGTEGDGVAGDGVWTARIPAAAFAPGEMTRWRVSASDRAGVVATAPPFRAPLDSDQYFGTVARDPALLTHLPVVHWFTTNLARAGTLNGSRGAVYYLGELYDNVLFTLHGQSSAGFPKKSYNLDFNRDHRFRWSTNAPRVADIDLISNWADKSKVRHVLAYEIMRESGVPAHFAFTVRVQHNGAFHSTADLIEDADEIYLERAGLNPEGALYKVYANQLNKDAGNTGATGVEKKTRRTEGNQDLQGLIDGLDLTGAALTRYLHDHVDIPACVNLVAANSVIRNIDMHSKNWYAYRDTGRSGEWSILPWDLDLSHGRFWNSQDTYYDNRLYTDDYVVNSTAIRLIAHLFAQPSTRAMILRRIRTLTDRFLQPPPEPGTLDDDLYYERRLNQLSALLDPPEIVPSDARRDFEKWGSWLQGGTVVPHTSPSVAVESMAEAILRWRNEYLPGRRRYIYETQVVGRGGEIPLPQNESPAVTNFTALVRAGDAARVLVPRSADAALAWTGEPDREPLNTAAWQAGRTGVGYERGTGYESLIRTDVGDRMAANNSVWIRLEFTVDDPAAFDRLQLRMKYDDGFVAFLNGRRIAAANAPASLAWNSASTVSREANPSAFTAFDATEHLDSLRAGRNVLAVHGLNDSVTSSDMVIVPELHAGRFVPADRREPRLEFGAVDVRPASGNQDEEYIELRNPNGIAVDLSGWRLAGGVQHVFPGGTVIPPAGSLYLSPNAAAFRARRESPRGGEGLLVQGGYRGHLSNLGEELVLLDGLGRTNAVVTTPSSPSDAQRYLVVSEVHYHPSGDGRSEFVELYNVSRDTALELTGIRFTAGISFDFSNGALRRLEPGARVVVVRDAPAFAAQYGTNIPVAGVFALDTALSNAGETVKLEDAENGTVVEFTYSDRAPWPEAADAGYSLVLLAPETRPDPALPTNWRASVQPGGRPGFADPLDPGFPSVPEADLDGNGERDLIDYAVGQVPGMPRQGLSVTQEPAGAAGEAGHGVLVSHFRSLTAAGVELGLQYSRDLSLWQEAAPHLELVARVPEGTSRERLTWRVRSSLREGAAVFLRLQAVPR